LRRAADRLGRRRPPPAVPDGSLPLWAAGFFALDRLPRFREAVGAVQAAILDDGATALLAEAWRIEHCGIDYCARMALVGESDDERRLFALIGADEAVHASLLAPWIAARAPEPDPFNRFIAGLAEAGNPPPLAYLLQVVLEGYGIVHIGSLAASCRDAGLAVTFKRIARDEALHHAGGLACFSPDRLGAADQRFLADSAFTFLQMIRCGPQGVVAAIDRSIGVGDRADAACVFAALDAETAGAGKLARLRRLMAQPGMDWLIAELDRGDAFRPCTATECAQIYVELR
jgi:hypothetical protein